MKTIKIGRGTNNDVVINDGVVSTYHAIITVSDFGEISIEEKSYRYSMENVCHSHSLHWFDYWRDLVFSSSDDELFLSGDAI